MFDLTKAQQTALLAIVDADGGAIDKYGRMVLRGEVSKHDAATWLRLAAMSLIVGDRNARMIPSNAGLAVANDIRK